MMMITHVVEERSVDPGSKMSDTRGQQCHLEDEQVPPTVSPSAHWEGTNHPLPITRCLLRKAGLQQILNWVTGRRELPNLPP